MESLKILIFNWRCWLNPAMGGAARARYKAERSFESDDIHSCNFIARRAVRALPLKINHNAISRS